MNWLTRYRHTRGYGVHSPFAFRFITECLGERWPYYAYDTFTGIEQCLALRLAAFLQPKEIRALSPDVARLAKAARRGCPAPIPTDAAALTGLGATCAALLIIGPAAKITASQINAALPAKNADAHAPNASSPSDGAHSGTVVWVLSNPEAASAIDARLDGLGCGMSFIDGDTAIFAAIPGLPRQTYSPKIP